MALPRRSHWPERDGAGRQIPETRQIGGKGPGTILLPGRGVSHSLRHQDIAHGAIQVPYPFSSGSEDSDMALDTGRIDDAILALLYLGLHDGNRAWKGFDWDALNRLHERGMISNPASKAKSVVFTKEGLRRSQELLEALFVRQI